MDRRKDAALLLARLLIGALFAAGAAQKALDPGPAAALLTGRALPGALVWPALAFNALAAASLWTGIGARPTALALAAYCAATSAFHLIPDDPWQMSIFVKNWAIAGGCLALWAAGPGRWRLGRRG